MSVLSGGVFGGDSRDTDELDELRNLVDDIGTRSEQARLGQRRLPELFDGDAWRALDETGLGRLTSDAETGAGPTESAVVLRGLARRAVAVPAAETDLLAAWLGGVAGIDVADGPLTVADVTADVDGERIAGTATQVPWSRDVSQIVLVVRTSDALLVHGSAPDACTITDGHNLAGEPRDRIAFELSINDFQRVDIALGEELTRRGAWARCIQCIGALDAAAELSVAHTTERIQFGRPLSKFQAVQHSLAQMAGEIERARAATELAVAAATDHGFADDRTDYAVTVAKVVLGRVVPAVATVAHQLHGAIGVTIEHPLWSATNRALSWVIEFGSTAHYARRLGRLALAAADDPAALWDVLTTGVRS